MLFVFPPKRIMDIIGVSNRKIFLGSQKTNESLWKTLKKIESGETDRLTPRTKAKLEVLVLAFRKNLYGEGNVPVATSNIVIETYEMSWNEAVQSINAGLKRTGEMRLNVFSEEAVRLEKIFGTIRSLIRQGDHRGALEQIGRWELAGTPCVQSILSQIDCKKSAREISTILAPLPIVTTLYLLACLAADLGDDQQRWSIIPEWREGRLVRPMTLWLEGLKVHLGIRSNAELSKRLLKSRSPTQSEESLKTLFDKWWQKGELVPWQRVQYHLLPSLLRSYRDEDRGRVELEAYQSLAAVRLMDELLNISIKIEEKSLANYESASPFRDYPILMRYAQEKKEALSSV